MFKVKDQWDCVVAEFDTREAAENYIYNRNSFYRTSPAIGPRFTIEET